MQRSQELTLPVYAPIPLDPSGTMSLDLGGAWNYLQPIADPFAQQPLPSDVTLQVPGELVMQGLPFDPTAAFALERSLTVPTAWAGRVIRLRFEAVYSQCSVWVDGHPAGHHLGGFTPFDLDLTTLAKPGEVIRITVHANNNSLANTLSQASSYAFHPLAGISRKVTLFALPADHLEVFEAATLFAPGELDRATLQLDLEVTKPGPVDIELVTPDGRTLTLGTHHVDGSARLGFSIDRPELWHTEHPALHTVQLSYAGSSYVRRIGFRDVRVENGRILLNGQSIYLRGVNHHETHPLTGRADTAQWAELDVKLFRAAHVNFLRTSHYPPTIEVVEACDAAGMLLEIEAPFCFAFGQFDRMPKWEELSAAEQAASLDYVPRVSLEMVSYYRSHPSVIIWSVANESAWAPPFETSALAIKQADPTRPTTYNWDQLRPQCAGYVDIANHHYPLAGEVAGFVSEPRPLMFDEFAHLYCYNGREMATDPGLRQHWGKFLAQQWNEIRDLPNGIGGSVWAAIDDHFYMPQRDGTRKWTGYGEWGPIDGWRRPKPEYEQMKRVFDPVHASRDGATITIENRFDFTTLSDVDIIWRAGGQSGSVALSAGPGETATFKLPVETTDAACSLEFSHSGLGYARRITLPSNVALSPHSSVRPSLLQRSYADRIGSWQFAPGANGAQLIAPGGEQVELSLAVVPSFPSWDASKRPPGKVEALDNLMGGWKLEEMRLTHDGIEFWGTYSAARGKLTVAVDSDGALVIDYDFKTQELMSPLQIGLCFDLPRHWDTLCWQLADTGESFSEDHISRARGQAPARVLNADEPTSMPPAWSWKDDRTELGSNDFRATKLGVERAGLFASDGKGLSVISDGSHHVRGEIRQGAARLLALNWAGEGSERFLTTFTQPLHLGLGNRLNGSVRLAYGDWF